MEESSVFSQSPFGTQPSSTPSSSGKGPGRRGKKLIFLVIIIIILAAIAFGAMQLLGNNGGGAPITPTPTIEEFIAPTDTPTPTPEEKTTGTPTPTTKAGVTPTPTKAASTSTSSTVDKATGLDRADLTLVVQNGSGESGVGKVMSDKLTGLGYKVSGTANADNFDYTQTVIQLKAANKDYLPLLKKDLGTDYTIGSATSDYAGSGDGAVIVGKE